MKLRTLSKQERVKKMFKRIAETNEKENTIYKANEETRRAIDALYVTKGNHAKVVAFSVFIALAIGLFGGIYLGMTTGSKSATQNVVEVKVVNDQLKAEPQPAQ